MILAIVKFWGFGFLALGGCIFLGAIFSCIFLGVVLCVVGLGLVVVVVCFRCFGCVVSCISLALFGVGWVW